MPDPGCEIGTAIIKTIHRPGKPDLEFHLCPLWMVAVGDTIIMPGRTQSSGAEMFGKVGLAESGGNALFHYVRLTVRVLARAGFEIVYIDDDSSRMRVWVMVP